MSANLDELRAKVDTLLVDELFSLQKHLIQQLRTKIKTNGNGSAPQPEQPLP